MFRRISHYFYIALKRYHFFIPFSKLKRIIKNHFNKGYFLLKDSSYQKWIKRYYPDFQMEDLKIKPLISVIIPVYNVKGKYLDRCIQSVLNQSYSNFEICIVDDASDNKETIKALDKYKKNKNIKIKRHNKNMHISITSNDAVKLAKGEYIAFLDNDDILDKNALYEMVAFLNNHPDAEMIYSDEDKVSSDGKYFYSPILKPDYSPDYLLNTNYICHFTMIKKTLFNKVGGFRIGYEGVQDWDLYLRVSEITNKIYHIPRILYHWSIINTSTSLSLKTKPYIIEKTKLLLEETIKRRKLNASLTHVYENIYHIDFSNSKEMISIIITGNNPNACIDSIINNIKTNNYEIIINGKRKYNNTVNLYIDNESGFINQASKIAKGDYLLIINEHVLLKDNIINNLIGYAKQKHVGAVGTNINIKNKYIISGRMIYNQGVIQDNIIVDMNDKFGIYLHSVVPYNTSVVKDNCLMISKEKFHLVNGFDENILDYNDLDFCLKLRQKGFYNVIEPSAILYSDNIAENIDITSIHNKWNNYNDPFYNINFDISKLYNFKITNYNNIKHVFIIGSRGYKYNYGGWETFVTNLLDHYNSNKVVFHISGINEEEQHFKINNNCYIDLFPLKGFNKIKMFIHTRKVIKYYEKFVLNNKINESIFYVLGLKLGNYLKNNLKKLHKNGIKIIVNPDGLEYKRGKYGIVGKLFFKHTEKSMLNNCDLIICDAKGIYNYICNKYSKNKIEKRIITYGVNINNDYLKHNEFVNKYNLKKDEYILVVGRLVPENNLSFIIKEYLKSNIKKKLVIVTNESIKYFSTWCLKEKIELNDNIIYLGPIYNSIDIDSLRYYAYAYIHGHSVGGTNPSLLEALYHTKLVIAYNVNFNKDICSDAALYFSLKEGSLTKILNNINNYQRDELHKKAVEIIKNNHTWDYIVNEYKKVWEDE